MRLKYYLVASAFLTNSLFLPILQAHDVPNPDGHIASNVNYGFNVIGRDTLAGVQDGLYTDVWSHKGYAYIGTFQEPACTRAGVFVVDMKKAIGNYDSDSDSPVIDGAVVAEIKSAPNTRVNDVKVHTITFQKKSRDVLIMTEEKCGSLNGNGRQLGQGGISLYDVTDPTKPHALKQHELDNQIHNTFTWTGDDGRSYLIAVDDEELNDVIIVDVSKPQSPKEIGRTGIEAWLDGSYPQIADDEQLFTGVFAAPLLHDVWVQKVDGRWLAILSYWDAGFVVLDVTDPQNPVALGDTTYPDPDPVYGTSPAEGNGHAAVFGGDQGQYLWAGDEDFDPFRTEVVDAQGVGHLASQGTDVPQIDEATTLAGEGVYVGLACSALDAAPDGAPDAAPDDQAIAVIQRGACAFTDKVTNAQNAGYAGAVVFNHATGCEASVSMLVSAGIPAVFLPRSDAMAVLGLGDLYDPDFCIGSGMDPGDELLNGYEGTRVGTVKLNATFDGWGYFHVINNVMGGTTTLPPPSVPGESPEDREPMNIGYLSEMGYFAPVELLDPALATGAGDLTMHNVEGDPETEGELPTIDAGPRSFISWYSAGLRAVEYRPGHWHTGNSDVRSWNVHEVGRYIAEDGSNFWGIHVDELDGQQVILASDRNSGLWLFSFDCTSEVLDDDGADTGLYCRR